MLECDRACAIVEAPQVDVELLLGERRIARRPVDLSLRIAEQMEGESAERIAAPVSGTVDGDTEVSIVVRVRRQQIAVAGGEWQTVAIDDRPARDGTGRGHQAWVVLIPVTAVSLLGEVGATGDGI